ncbi:phosphotransferase enzyme family protein [Deinococcus hohokamensis]|uniref:Phosphotransferase enzyme family protein n=1 Tax=Deinococcus hohokamensis TaxID=309883 RepID=A0ABV9I7X2_9DEIO
MPEALEPQVASCAAQFGLTNAQVARTHVGYRGTETYLVQGDEGALFLRRYSRYWQDRPAQITFELEWLDHLTQQGLPVVRPVRTRHGGWVAQDRGLPVVAFEPVAGEPRYPLPQEDARALGCLLGAVHLASAPEAPPGVFRYDQKTLLTVPLTFGLKHLHGVDAQVWTQAGEQLRAALASIPTEGVAFGPVHADLHQWNVHWTEDGPQVLDFALCGVGYRLFDLAAFLWPRRDETLEQPGVTEMCEAFVDGYTSVRPLLPAETAALDAFVKLRDLWEMNDFADWDVNFSAPKDVPGYLARFRAYPGSLRWED